MAPGEAAPMLPHAEPRNGVGRHVFLYRPKNALLALCWPHPSLYRQLGANCAYLKFSWVQIVYQIGLTVAIYQGVLNKSW